MRIPKDIIDQEALRNFIKKSIEGTTGVKSEFQGESSRIISDLVSSVGALGFYQIHQSGKNSYMPTANSPKAIELISKTLGILRRGKEPTVFRGQVKGNDEVIVSDSPKSLPYELWVSQDGTEFVCSNIQLLSGTKESYNNLIVTQLKKNEIEFEGRGESFDYNKISIGYDVDLNTLKVFVNESEFTKADSLLLDDSRKVYVLNWDEKGSLIIEFGIRNIHDVPEVQDRVRIVYYTSKGSNGRNYVGQKLKPKINDSDTEDVKLDKNKYELSLIEYVSGGFDEESTENLKRNSPKLFAANRRAVRRDDYKAHIDRIPEVKFSRVFGELELEEDTGIKDITNMNKIRLSLLGEGESKVVDLIDDGEDSNEFKEGDITFGTSDLEGRIKGSFNFDIGSGDSAVNLRDFYGEDILFNSLDNKGTLIDVKKVGAANAKFLFLGLLNKTGATYTVLNYSEKVKEIGDYFNISFDEAPTPESPIILCFSLDSFTDLGVSFDSYGDGLNNGFISKIGNIFMGNSSAITTRTTANLNTTNWKLNNDSLMYRKSFYINRPYANKFTDIIPLKRGNITNDVDENSIGTGKAMVFISVTGVDKISLNKGSFTFKAYVHPPYYKISEDSGKIKLTRSPDSGVANYTKKRISLPADTPYTANYISENVNENFSSLVLSKMYDLIPITNELNIEPPYIRYLDFDIELRVSAESDPDNIQNQVKNSINKYIDDKVNSGGDILISDIYNIVISIRGVISCVIYNPVNDIRQGLTEYYKINNINIEVIK